MKNDNTKHVEDPALQKILNDYEQLKESETRYKRLVEAAPDITYIYGTKSGAKFWSPQVKNILGITPESLINDPFAWINAIHPEDRINVNELLSNLDKIKTFSIEYRVKDIHGTWHWLNDRTVSVKKVNNEYIIEGLAQDITEKKKIEQELRTSEEKFRKAFMTSTDSININRLHDGLYVSINPGFTRITGYDEKDVAGKTSLELNIWKDPADRKKLVNALLENGQYSNLEAVFITKDGQEKRGLMSASLIKLDNEDHIISITRDITDYFNINKKLEKNQFLLEKSQEIGNIGTWEIDLKTNIVNWTDQVYQIFGIEEKKSINYDYFLEFLHPDDRSYVIKSWEEALNGKTYDVEHRIIVNGQIKWVRQKANINKNDSLSDGKIIGTIQDITNRRNIEEALLQSENQYRLIVENANDGIEISQNDEFIYKNSQFIKMLGYVPDEFEKITFKDIYTEQGLKDLFERHKKRMAGETLPNKYETTFRKKDGSIIDVEVTYQLINYHNSDATFAIIHDITENKENEKALKIALEQAKESDHLKSAFLANMSHEIRTPMNGIIGFTNLLKSKKLSEEKREQYLDIIEKSGERLMNIINDLIDISKIEAKQIEISKTNFNLNEIIDFLYEFFLPECSLKNIVLEEVKQDHDIFLYTDKDKLEAILINLLKNAIKFTNEGQITFGYMIIDKNITFYVNDTGIGIPDEKQKFIFDRFAQVDNSISKPYEGAGLGLSISSAFVEMLGGELLLESTLRKGSKFYFTLPYRQKHTMVLSEDAPIAPAINTKQKSRDKLKVLIAEDDEFSYQFISILMQEFSDTILYAKNGKEAIDICKNNPGLDLILMDMKMPILDGYQATKYIRKFNQDVIIIAQTAYAFTDDKEKVIEAGCNDYLSKPIHDEDLKALVNKLFYQ